MVTKLYKVSYTFTVFLNGRLWEKEMNQEKASFGMNSIIDFPKKICMNEDNTE